MTGQCWIVVRSKPRQEIYAAHNIARFSRHILGETYPPYIQMCRTGDKIEPLFKSIVFVAMQDAWYFIRNCWGVLHIIMRGESPAAMPEFEMTRMKRMESTAGFVELPVRRQFNIDTKVTVESGPFAARTGICAGYESDRRVRVLIEFLGGTREVLFDESALRV
jgi:transcription antitermination factor NusG